MALSVAVAKVKQKCSLADASYDSAIADLIADLLPAIEFALRTDCLASTPNAELQATLNLGAAELIAGEFLAQLARAPGASETLRLGPLEIRPAWLPVEDPFGLKAQGARRLAPYLRSGADLVGSAGVMGAPPLQPVEGPA